jgi:putative oxidoreductase
MADLLATPESWPLFVVRVVLGVIFFAHGAQKLFGWFGGYGLAGTAGYFKQQLGIPAPLTTLVALVETLGGLGLVVGLLARLAALGVGIDMVVAIAKVHAPNGFFINWSLEPGKGHGYEMNLALIAMALAVLIGGAGALSIDGTLVPVVR